MNSTTLENEKKYLQQVENQIEETEKKSLETIESNRLEIEKHKEYFAENFYDIKTDGDELANINIQIESLEKHNDSLVKLVNRLNKQKHIPYFGRIDFKQNNKDTTESYYIGIGHIRDDEKNLVYDWRADVASLYYDDTIGKTSYICPFGQVDGELKLKRQYKINDGNLDYYIDSSLVINDDILMEELSKNSTSKMHDIVSTIQKEQNELIRTNEIHNTIVQGVAGSGKTSVALHRVSYLLFKYKDRLKNDDVLILSPSEHFSNYIDDVLPSIGDEKAYTTTFAHIAKNLLGYGYKSRDEILDKLIGSGKQKDFENIAIKYSFEFLEDFKSFLQNDICNLFVPKTLVFGNLVIEEKDIRDIYYNKLNGLPIYKRIEAIAEHIVNLFNIPPTKNVSFYERAKSILYSKLITTDLLRIYNIFLRSVDLEEIETVGAYDIAQILLIKENIYGFNHNYDAKYVIVDEMQDYTPCHFYLFDKLWDCPKMYLGDINQSIDKTLDDNFLSLLAKETKSKLHYLTKSYRSTLQISKFSQKILGKTISKNVNRNGDEVEFIKTKDIIKALERQIKKKMKECPEKSLCIICKDKEEIEYLRKNSELIDNFTLLNEDSSIGDQKNMITTILSAKGVEFDMVIVPFANDEKYNNELDRNLLYVSSTRALHNLCFIADKKPSRFLTKTETKN